MSVLQRWVIQSSELLRTSHWKRSSERIGGPAVRAPFVSYWPPWHGHAKPRLVAAIGQPRCMHRVENTTNIASWACQSVFFWPVWWTKASAALVGALLGSSRNVAAVGVNPLSDVNASSFPRNTGPQVASF